MRILLGVTMIAGIALAAAGVLAQPPGEGRRDGSAGTADSFVARLFAYDTNGDGKLSNSEMTDKRLQPLFDRADADHDGVVSKQELQALYERESLAQAGSGRGGPPGGPGGQGGPGRGFGGPGGPGGGPRGGPGGPDGGPGGGGDGFEGGPGGPGGFDEGGFGEGGPGGRGGQRGRGMGGPPRPGEIMPSFLQDRLELTEKQKKQIQELQAEVDAKLAKILTKEQKQQMDNMRNNFRGPPGGPGGFGPPGGGPGGGPGAGPGGEGPGGNGPGANGPGGNGPGGNGPGGNGPGANGPGANGPGGNGRGGNIPGAGGSGGGGRGAAGRPTRPDEGNASNGPDNRQSGGTEDDTGRVAAGQKVFATANCGRCHQVGAASGGPRGGGRGPNLSKVGANSNHTVASLMAFIRNPKSERANSRMPGFPADKISDADLKSLAQYLASLK